MRDHFFYRQFRHALELQQAGGSLLGEIAQIRRLLSGQADAAHFGIGEFENALRHQRIAGKSGEAIEDGHGRFAVQLLIEDRLRQRVKRGLAILHAEWADPLDDRGHHGVGFLQVVDCFAHRSWLLDSSWMGSKFSIWANKWRIYSAESRAPARPSRCWTGDAPVSPSNNSRIHEGEWKYTSCLEG